mmetsp:Transcript_47733/g.78626  ORF Transcript_47733/g.78626 Transcript_47733/m.78626 type:complete len:90 (+) Transcript_47733:744-1013(+)
MLVVPIPVPIPVWVKDVWGNQKAVVGGMPGGKPPTPKPSPPQIAARLTRDTNLVTVRHWARPNHYLLLDNNEQEAFACQNWPFESDGHN